jgi:hypothetical protein
MGKAAAKLALEDASLKVDLLISRHMLISIGRKESYLSLEFER